MRKKPFSIFVVMMLLLTMLLGAVQFGTERAKADGTWVTKANMLTGRTEFAVGVLNDKIYAIGGVNTGPYLATVEMYDPVGNSWVKKADMPTARRSLAVGCLGNNIYAFGGYGNNGTLKTVEMYDINANNWTIKTSMPTARSDFAVGVVDGKFYLFGGEGLNSLDMYDPITNNWTTKAKIPTGRYGLAAGVVDGKIYAIGGYNASSVDLWLSSVEMYDPIANTWTIKTNMPTARNWLTVGVVDGKIYAIGGKVNHDALVEMYNPATNIWTTEPSRPPPYTEVCGVIGNKIYVMGGMSGGVYLSDMLALDFSITVPSVPPNLQATVAYGSIYLSWDAPASNGGSAITNYTIYRGTTSESITWYKTLGNVLSYLDMDALAGSLIYYQVSAINEIGEGNKSSMVNTSSSISYPEMPQNLQATGGNAQVTLSWSAPTTSGASAIISYKIYRGTLSIVGLSLIKTLGNVLTYTDIQLTNDITYYYQVSAVNGIGEGNKSWVANATPRSGSTVPYIPTNLQATAGNRQVTLSWTAPTSNGGLNIISYNIYRRTASGTSALLTTVGNVLAFTDTTVSNNITYFYRISAVNSIGEGAVSEEINAMPSTTSGGTGNILFSNLLFPLIILVIVIIIVLAILPGKKKKAEISSNKPEKNKAVKPSSPINDSKTLYLPPIKPNVEEPKFKSVGPTSTNNLISEKAEDPIQSPPTSIDFEKAINLDFEIAREKGEDHVILVSGDLHRKLGGYPGSKHRMPICCNVMRKMMEPGDKILEEPPKGNGATLKIRYSLPRGVNKKDIPAHRKIIDAPEKAVAPVSMEFLTIVVPEFVDSGSSCEILLTLKNKTDREIKNISIDFSDLEEFFTLEGEVDIRKLRPGMELKKAVHIKPRHEEGIFPVKIAINSDGETIIKEYKIKVGGTEVY
jgi:hypothetical protein